MEKLMKTTPGSLRSSLLKLFMVWVLASGSVNLLFAQDEITSIPGAEVKYLGTVDNKLIFQIDYKSDSKVPFSLEIKDQSGYQFYFGKFKSNKYSQKFAIERTDLGKNAITFVLTAQDNVHRQVFDVNASYRVVEEVSVVRL